MAGLAFLITLTQASITREIACNFTINVSASSGIKAIPDAVFARRWWYYPVAGRCLENFTEKSNATAQCNFMFYGLFPCLR